MTGLNDRLSRRALIGGLVAAPVVLRFGRAQAGADLFSLGV
ncbi:MAG: alkaline phosphatase D, partial [Brevundimonas sp.]